MLSRINVSDFFLNNYYYMWTIFWYIPMFATLVYITISFLNSYMRIKILVLLLLTPLLLLNVIEVIDYWYLNTSIIDFRIHGEFVNTLLTNSINKYHPLILYISIGLLYSFILYCLNTIIYISRIYQQQLHILPFSRSLYITLYFNYWALALGSWWAIQEGSWGGWWNWDPSEVFGFVVFIGIVFYIHKSLWNSKLYLSAIDFISILIFIAILYYFMQLNFNLISHNFGLRGMELTNKLQFYWAISVVLIYVQSKIKFTTMGYTNYINVININNFHKIPYESSSKLISYVILITLISLVVMSYYPIILNFMLNITGISMSNLPNYITTIVLYIVIFISLNFFNILNSSLISSYIIIFGLEPIILNFLITSFMFKTNYLYLNHKYIFIFILVSFTNYYKHNLLWLTEGENFFWLSNLTNYSIGSLNFSINPSLIEVDNGIRIINNNYLLPSLGLCSLCSTSEINIFSHEVTVSLPTQTLTSGSLLKLFLTTSYEYNFSNLVITLIIISTLFYFNHKGNYNFKY